MFRGMIAISFFALQLLVFSNVNVSAGSGRDGQSTNYIATDEHETAANGLDARLLFSGDPMLTESGAPQLVVTYSPIIVKIVLDAGDAEEMAAELEEATYNNEYYNDGDSGSVALPQRLSLVIQQVLRALDSAGLGESGTLVQLPPYNVNFVVEEPQEEDDGDAEGT